MAETGDAREPFSRRRAAMRLAIGLTQGVGLYLLSEAAEHKLWPATAPPVFGALVLIFALIPFVILGGVGRMRPATLAIWAGVAAAILAAFAWTDLVGGVWEGGSDRLAPAPPVFLFSAVFLFIGHHLIGPADAERRWTAPYPAYFDGAWKDAVQLALSVAFVAVLWAALELGGQLFKLIGINTLADLISERWFAFPVTATAFAAAVQLTDVRVGLIRGVRTIGLLLLSWLLPVMAVIVVAFLVALPFTGLAPLFKSISAGGALLAADGALIVLLGAAYQDGQTPVPLVQRWAGRAAALALVPLTAIAGYAIALRVAQYGLTPARVMSLACVLVAAGFAGGYAWAALRPKAPWMKFAERVNLAMAAVAMLAIIALLTPIADPARLSVDDQTSRLVSGHEPPEAFDYRFLRFNSGRYGRDALARLARGTGSARNLLIAAKAKEVLAPEYEGPVEVVRLTASRFRVHPAGAVLPPTFLTQNWSSDAAAPDPQGAVALCAHVRDTCEAFVFDIDGDRTPEVLVGLESEATQGLELDVLQAQPDGRWISIGTLPVACADAVAALRAGQLKLAPRTGYDVELAGRRQGLDLNRAPNCPAARAPVAAPEPPHTIRRP